MAHGIIGTAARLVGNDLRFFTFVHDLALGDPLLQIIYKSSIYEGMVCPSVGRLSCLSDARCILAAGNERNE